MSYLNPDKELAYRRLLEQFGVKLPPFAELSSEDMAYSFVPVLSH